MERGTSPGSPIFWWRAANWAHFIGVATLAATEIGTITFMYYAELGYKTGFASFINGLIAGAGDDLYWPDGIHYPQAARAGPDDDPGIL